MLSDQQIVEQAHGKINLILDIRNIIDKDIYLTGDCPSFKIICRQCSIS